MKRAPNPWLKRISKTVCEPDCQKAIEILVQEIRNPEQSLDSLSKHLGIDKIVREPLPFEGGVYELDGSRLIRLNSLAVPVRQNFTLAHEIGHLILEHRFEATLSCTEDETLERACDKIASELLMPSGKVIGFARRLGEQSPEKLSQVANHFGVSFQAAAQRLSDLGLWNWGTGMWKCSPEARELWFVGRKPWNTDRPSFSAFELAVESKIPVCTQERFSKGPYTELVALKAHHIGKNFVIAIVATNRK